MFLGIESHHIADLCTPVHVGHTLDYQSLGFPSLARFHKRVERDIEKYAPTADVRLRRPSVVPLDRDLFWGIARDTYERSFLDLVRIYANRNSEALQAMASRVVSEAVGHTADLWHTILASTGMAARSWSMQPLL